MMISLKFTTLTVGNQFLAEFFSKKWFVPGALFSAHPYQLKDAVALFGFVLKSSNSLATRSTILFHYNYRE